MAESLLVRHGEAFVNKREFAAFGNEDSPLTERGVGQSTGLNQVFKDEYGIVPEEYTLPVLSYHYKRTQQTAELAGFTNIEVSELIAESDIPAELVRGKAVSKKHAEEKWAPDEVLERTARLIELIRSNEISHKIFFSHGLYRAALLLNLEKEYAIESREFPYEFREDYGYIPRTATITRIEI